MSEENKETNMFVVSGKLQEILHLKTGTFITIAFNTSNGRRYRVFMRYNGNTIGLYPHLFVTVNGHVTSVYNKNFENKETKLVADNITSDQDVNKMIFKGEKSGKGYLIPHNRVYLSGRIVKVTEDNIHNWRRLVIKVGDEEIEISSNLRFKQPCVNKDDYVYAVCSIDSREEQTKKMHIKHITRLVTSTIEVL